MTTEDLIHQAVGGVTRGSKLLGAASLINRRLLLTSAEIFSPNARDLKIKFGNHRPLKVRVVDYSYVPGIGKNYSLLEIMEDGADARMPLSFGVDVGDGPEIIIPKLDFHEQISEMTMNRGLIRAVQPQLDPPAWLFDYKPGTTPHGLLPGTPFVSVEGPHQGIVGILSKKFGTGMESFTPNQLAQPLYPVIPTREILTVSRYLKDALSPSVSEGPEVAEIERSNASPEGAHTESLRYPIAEFYRLGGDDQNIVPPSAPLVDSPSGGGLELRFRLDEQRTGIPYVGEPPTFRKPAEYEYPLTLEIDVWSEVLRFDADDRPSARRQIEVNERGPSTEARFPVFLPPLPDRAAAAVFVFVRHEKFLLAAFRVQVPLEAEGGTQTLEHIYLSEKWFSIPSRNTVAPALTLYVRHESKGVFIFAFSQAGDKSTEMWAATSCAVESFRKKTVDIYLEVGELAEEREPNSRQPFLENAYDLCHMGQDLFSYLFFSGTGTPAAKILSDLAGTIRSLPEGSDVVIATDDTSQPFTLPWGLIYDAENLPQPASGGEKLNGFWGARFRLSVQPTRRLAWPANVNSSGKKLTVGKVYENHELAPEMSKILTELVDSGRIDPPGDLAIESYSMPALKDQPFDYLHFFCHGYTELFDQELINRILNLVDQPRSAPRNQDLMYSPGVKYGSHISTQSGIAKHSVLQEKVQQIAGSPIVQLSMCQSAQVSASGKSFVIFFLERGARAVVGTEGPNPWALALNMDTAIIRDLFKGESLGTAVWNARRMLVKEDILALIYSVYGDADAQLVTAQKDLKISTT